MIKRISYLLLFVFSLQVNAAPNDSLSYPIAMYDKLTREKKVKLFYIYGFTLAGEVEANLTLAISNSFTGMFFLFNQRDLGFQKFTTDLQKYKRYYQKHANNKELDGLKFKKDVAELNRGYHVHINHGMPVTADSLKVTYERFAKGASKLCLTLRSTRNRFREKHTCLRHKDALDFIDKFQNIDKIYQEGADKFKRLYE